MGETSYDKSDELNKAVSSTSSESKSQTIPDEETWIISKMWGSACHCGLTKAQISFDTDILFVTHGDLILDNQVKVTGNGTKQLTIKLQNDSDNQETMSGGYIARKDNS